MEVIEKEIGNVLICSIKGQILLCTEEECRKYFEKLSEEKSRTSVIINMSGVGYVNNAGVGMIVKLQEVQGKRRQAGSLFPDTRSGKTV